MGDWRSARQKGSEITINMNLWDRNLGTRVMQVQLRVNEGVFKVLSRTTFHISNLLLGSE